jgi:di/tripeptidase
MNFGAALNAIRLPSEPRTTYNIGLIEGGSSVNTIAPHAQCYLDLRSSQTQALADLETHVRQLAAQHSPIGVRFLFEQVGDRPSGAIAESHPLVYLAKQASHAIGITPEIEAASTDANAFLARGIPAVCMGLTFGANAHTLEEYIEIAPIADGLWQLALLTCASANALPAW